VSEDLQSSRRKFDLEHSDSNLKILGVTLDKPHTSFHNWSLLVAVDLTTVAEMTKE